MSISATAKTVTLKRFPDGRVRSHDWSKIKHEWNREELLRDIVVSLNSRGRDAMIKKGYSYV